MFDLGDLLLGVAIAESRKASTTEEEKIVVPEYVGENTAIGCRVGRCSCSNTVRSSDNYCCMCGVKLDWRYCHAD